MKNKKYYERAAEILRHDPETGGLFRTLKDGKSKEAGSIDSGGYRQVSLSINGQEKLLLAHRIIHFIHHGELPDCLDHIDGDRLNNRIENLRAATSQQNQRNIRSQKNSSSKFLGVNWQKTAKKWRARIKFNGKQKSLGLFTDEIEAAKAYDAAAREHHGEFANPNFK